MYLQRNLAVGGNRQRRKQRAPADLGRDSALSIALRLYRSPILARSLRQMPLPADMIDVIRIAGGCTASLALAAKATKLDNTTLLDAVSLYLLVVLFRHEEGPHRTLGLSARADAQTAQEHRRWLLKWLHPDRNPNPAIASLSVQVLDASARLFGQARSVQSAPEGGVEVAESQRRRSRATRVHVWRRVLVS